MNSCLIVVDAQKVFVKNTLPVVQEKIREVLQHGYFDYKVATKFVNLSGSFYERYLGWCEARGEDECSLIDGIESLCDCTFTKTQYSVFTDEFVNFLQDNDIGRLYFAGYDLDGCILSSAIAAFDRCIDFSVITDCCGTSGGQEIEASAVRILERLVGKRQLVTLNTIMHDSELMRRVDKVLTNTTVKRGV